MRFTFLVLSLFLFSSNASAAPAIIAAFAYIGVAVTAFQVYSTLAMIALTAYSYSMARKIKPAGMSQQDMKQLLKVSRASKQIVYGETLISGALLFAEEQLDDVENDDGTYSEWLYLAVGVCDHAIDSHSSLYLDDMLVGEYGANAVVEVKNDVSVVDNYLLANAPSWQADMIGKGTTWLRVALKFDRELFGSGVPTPRMQFKGRKVWDPRTDTTYWSNNAALVILDFFINYRGIPKSRIMVSGRGSFIDAANLCDEFVTNPDNSQSRRYTINGGWVMDEKPSAVLADLMMSCGATLVRTNGMIGLLPAAFYGPASITLTASDVIGDIVIQPEPAFGDSVNTIKGSYIDPSLNYVETDFASVVDEAAKVRDGGELSEDMNFRFVTDPYQAQRLASIALKRNLTGGMVTLTTNLKGMYCTIGRLIELDLADFGLVGEYRVLAMSSHISEGVNLSLARDDITIYDDSIGTAFVPPPLTSLPIGGVFPPIGLMFETEYIGEVVQGRFRWQIKDPNSVSTDFRIRNITTNAIVYNTNTSGNMLPVNGLVSGDYAFEIRTVTQNLVSAWQSLSVTIGLPSPVTSVAVTQSNWSVSLVPSVTGLVAGTSFAFEYYHLQDTGSYINGNPAFGDINFPSAKFIGVGSSFTQAGLQPDRWQHYWVRTINAYGKSTWFYVKTGSLLDESSLAPILQGNINFDWLGDDLTTMIETIEDGLGNQQAAWQIASSVSGVTSSIAMVNDGVTSKIFMVADDFVLTDATHTTYQEAPFVLTGGRVYIKSSFINELQSVSITTATISATTMTSQNWEPGENGYKMWGTGEAEFNNVTVRGNIQAESGNIEGLLSIGGSFSNYIDGRADSLETPYAAVFGSGACTIKKNGDFYAQNGLFEGQIKAEKIIGDIVSAIAKTTSPAVQYNAVGTTLFDTINVNTARPYPRTLVFTLQLKLETNRATAGTDFGRIKVSGSFGTLYGRNVTGVSLNPGVSESTFSLSIPAHETGVVSIYSEIPSDTVLAPTSQVRAITSSPTTNNIWSVQLFKNGSDLS